MRGSDSANHDRRECSIATLAMIGIHNSSEPNRSVAIVVKRDTGDITTYELDGVREWTTCMWCGQAVPKASSPADAICSRERCQVRLEKWRKQHDSVTPCGAQVTVVNEEYL